MKLKLKITGLSLVSDNVLVQMQGRRGHASFTVPADHAPALHINQEAVLEVSGAEDSVFGQTISAVIDETKE